MKIEICICTYCHLQGAREVVEKLQALVARHGLKDSVELAGTFCQNDAQDGVRVTVDGKAFTVKPADVDAFFRTEILGK